MASRLDVRTGTEAVRESAEAMRKILAETDNDPSLAPEAVADVLRPLLAQLDLFDVGLPRTANHTDATRVIYFDPSLTYILARASNGQTDPPHNHGVWNITAVSTGAMHYRAYRRLDDGTKSGYAELELVDDRVLHHGDIGIVPPPPHDIHEVTVLADDQWTLALAPGMMLTTREYYDLETNSYVEKAAAG